MPGRGYIPAETPPLLRRRSKTEERSIHIGNFRDIATSLFVVKALHRKGKKAKLLFSWDEFDRLRKVPVNVQKTKEGMEKYIGCPYVDVPNPFDTEEKKALILDNGLALWDSIGSCEITGSSDASIRNAEPNDLRIITGSCDIRAIYCNGKKSLEVYNRYIEPVLGRPAEALPSTSPANAAWSLERLIEAWSVVKRD